MGKKSKSFIDPNDFGEDFYTFLQLHLDYESRLFIENLCNQTKVYIFSGIIRNYFLNIYSIRDLDIVIESEKNLSELIDSKYERNSFGGYKIKFDNLSIDLWEIKSTWAIKKNPQKSIETLIWSVIPKTSFFNFSSIIYSISEKKFIYEKSFLEFLKTKTLKIVHEPNPNPALCIINSFYYAQKYNLEIGKELLIFIEKNFDSCKNDLINTQIKHFGEVKYSLFQLSIMKASLHRRKRKSIKKRSSDTESTDLIEIPYKITTNGLKYSPKNKNSAIKPSYFTKNQK